MNIFKKHIKIISTTTLAAVITVSMSFKSQESVDVKSQEETVSFNNMPTKEVDKVAKLKGFNAAVAGIGVTVGIAGLGVNVYNAVRGGYADHEIAKANPSQAVKAKMSQFD